MNPIYKLQVNGTVAADEVVVTTALSDYVFDPGYRLTPLAEVSAFIEKNHHLPDIPSSAEAKEKGVGLADLQTKLLAKIEELTLHMIQAEERNNRLEQQINCLQDRLKKPDDGQAAPPSEYASGACGGSVAKGIQQ